jgi:glycerol uptake facilitator-like aquaporin
LPIEPLGLERTVSDYNITLAFNEFFGSSILCFVFLSLRYRKDLNSHQRDPVLNAAALALALFAMTQITYTFTLNTFFNPVVALF